METSKQQRALKRFVKKVKKLPCEFWNTPDELAYQVSSTLSIKFKENNRNGWMPFNPYGVSYSGKIDGHFVGNYNVLYYSELKGRYKKLIQSKLIINRDGITAFYNNIRNDVADAEYTYHGVCRIEDNVIYIYLYNDFSSERVTIYLMRSVGNLNRFIGLMIALSSNLIPVCIKISCFKEELYQRGVNERLLKEIITSNNVNWENNMLIIEETQKHLFFSDDMLGDKK